nr:hypothetical protein [Prevotella sp.]
MDGNENNFFHMSWTAPKPFPHYIVFDLGAPHKALQFRYVCRMEVDATILKLLMCW